MKQICVCTYFCGLMFLAAALQGNEPSEDFENIPRVAVGEVSEVMSEEAQERLAAGADASRSAAAEDRAEGEEEEIFTKPLFETTHPAAFYTLFHVYHYTGKVELCDRSIWRISPGYSVVGWAASDYVTISQSGYADYPFSLTNQRRSEYVYAKLDLGPDIHSTYRMRIKSIYIDYNGQTHITVKDGLGQYSRWVMSLADYATLAWWSPGETVMVGLNTNVHAQGSNILINVKRNNFASGSCVEY